MKDWEIDITNDHPDIAIDEASLRRFLKIILLQLEYEPIQSSIANLSITFTDDKQIQELNRDYRGKDKPTDVLSFSLIEGEEGGPVFSLGDIVISLDMTLKQAAEYDVAFDQELARLLIHGLLHLYGYDHEEVPPEEAEEMQSKEDLLMEVFFDNSFAFRF